MINSKEEIQDIRNDRFKNVMSKLNTIQELVIKAMSEKYEIMGTELSKVLVKFLIDCVIENILLQVRDSRFVIILGGFKKISSMIGRKSDVEDVEKILRALDVAWVSIEIEDLFHEGGLLMITFRENKGNVIGMNIILGNILVPTECIKELVEIRTSIL
jgi:hypothetical protein